MKETGKRIPLNEGWYFTSDFREAPLGTPDISGMQPVRLPHTTDVTPFNYFDASVYQHLSLYRRILPVKESWEGKCLLLTVEGAAHRAKLYINGKEVCEHRCGYTAFTADIAEYVTYGEDNVIDITVDSREDLDQPPFGFVIDYMTYSGLYREVSLEIREKDHIEDVFHCPVPCFEAGGEPTGKGTVTSFVTLAGDRDACVCQVLSEKATGKVISEGAPDVLRDGQYVLEADGIRLWDTDDPVLYELRTVLLKNGEAVDETVVSVGFRTAEFRADGFYLNGRKLRIRGLNRHQSYPYVGYAMPASMQKLDADIMKKELGLNAVRTSHYPQSRHFIDRCDEVGLLVFTEIPGWQHIGGQSWKDQAVKNTSDMVLQYRNHPSVILWGVRINESADCDELYRRTNEEARRLDPTRPTAGVRNMKKSSFLEDVYTYNDFIHDGTNVGCEPKKAVTSDTGRAYLITEYCGHMFPTKMYDDEIHRTEHALRHARVLDAVASNSDIAGSFGWCLADYNTHRDFGSGDGICYHGVMDMFRNPKPASFIYAAEGLRDKPVLAVTSSFSKGENPTGNPGRCYIISNADSVKMYRNDRFVREYFPGDSTFSHLEHGPVLIDDFIGDALKEDEGMPEGKAELFKQILNGAAIEGFSHLSASMKLKALRAMVFHGARYSDAEKLYSRYIGDWGKRGTGYRFDAVKNGATVGTLVLSSPEEVRCEAKADHTVLTEADTYDVAEIRIRLTDENSNQLYFMNCPLSLTVEGPLEVIGPAIVSVRGGAAGTYVKTTGIPGDAVITIHGEQIPDTAVRFSITTNEEDR